MTYLLNLLGNLGKLISVSRQWVPKILSKLKIDVDVKTHASKAYLHPYSIKLRNVNKKYENAECGELLKEWFLYLFRWR